MVAYAAGAAALAQYVNEQKLRDVGRRSRCSSVPSGCGRTTASAIEQAFGPAFETYGCREVMLMASECERHDGMHTSMETMIVELVVREPDGTTRAARPGETGEVVRHRSAQPRVPDDSLRQRRPRGRARRQARARAAAA